MILKEFLLHHTKAGTLVHIVDSGYNVGCTFIDYEDLFIHSLDNDLVEKEIYKYEWGHIDHNTEHGDRISTPCLVVDIGFPENYIGSTSM